MKKIKLAVLLISIFLFGTTCTPFEPSPIKAYTLEVTYGREDITHPERLYVDWVDCTIGVPNAKIVQTFLTYRSSGDYLTYMATTQEKIADNSEYGITAGDLARGSDDAWLSWCVGTTFKIRVVETGSELVLTNIVQLSQWSYAGSTENGRMAIFRIQNGLLY